LSFPFPDGRDAISFPPTIVRDAAAGFQSQKTVLVGLTMNPMGRVDELK
jgi:hypothetical protein